MPLKLKKTPIEPPESFDSLEEAFMHFLLRFYEGPENPETFKQDTDPIHHAFIYGAWYMKRLVRRAQSKTPQEMHTHIAKLYKELAEQTAAAPPAQAPAPQQRPESFPREGVATEGKVMTWTVTMLREFQAAYMQARERGAPTFPFRDKTFRTVDAVSIIQHLQNVFAPEQKVIQPHVIPPQP
jgi:hypothetical protein